MTSKLKPGWRWVKFGDVVRQVKDKVDPETSGLDRYIAGEHMDTDELHIRRWGEINGDYLGPAFHMHFKPGQVLYGSRRTYLRKVAVPHFEGICANTTFVLEPKDPAVLLPEMLPFIMQTEKFHEHSIKQSKGSVNPYVNFSDLAWWEFALPPLGDQKRIVELLSSADSFHNSLMNLQAKLDYLRKALILDEFSQLMLMGKVPIQKVEEAGDVLMGRQLSPKYKLGLSPKPYLRVANVFDGYIDTTDVKEMDFSDQEFQDYHLQLGDVLLNEGQSRELVGRSSIFRGEVPNCCFQNTLIRFRPHKVSSEFAQHYFQYCFYTGRFAAVAKQTTTIAHLGVRRFAEMPFPIPDEKTQKEISATISQIEHKILSQRSLENKMQRIKRLNIKECSMLA
jgi:type I restriction enzyme S subunit